jgi:hypothetical protein
MHVGWEGGKALENEEGKVMGSGLNLVMKSGKMLSRTFTAFY